MFKQFATYIPHFDLSGISTPRNYILLAMVHALRYKFVVELVNEEIIV
jgi:hypothetical protein